MSLCNYTVMTIISILDFILISISIVMAFKFCKNKQQNKKITQKLLEIIFIVMTFVFLLMYPLGLWNPCTEIWDKYIGAQYAQVYIFIYYGQNGAMITLTFYKLYFVLQNTALKTTKSTNICIFFCNTIFWILPISLIIYLIIFNQGTGYIIHICAMGLLFIILFLWANILLIYKLNKVQRFSQDEQIKQLIRKITTLYSTSVFITVTYNLVLTMIMTLSDDSDWVEQHIDTLLVIAIIAFLLDIFTNFLCVMLTYNVFNDWYINLCGKIEIGCIKCLSCQIC